MQTKGAAVDRGGATGTAQDGNGSGNGNGSRVGAATFKASNGGATAVAGRLTETDNNSDGDDGPSDNHVQKGAAEVSRSPSKSLDATATDLAGRGNGKDSHERNTDSSVVDKEKKASHPPPRVGCLQPNEDRGQRGRLSRPTTPGSEGGAQKEDDVVLHGVREGPVRDVLTALLTSTVMAEDGGRVLMPTFPSVSALRELKYCGPLEPRQVSALKRVLFSRCARRAATLCRSWEISIFR